MKIFSGSSNEPLAKKVCEYLGIPQGEIFLKTFPSGERYCQFHENIRGQDVFLIQSTSAPCNDNLMELLVMCDAARRASAGSITAVIPYFGYARQERKDKPRVPISAKLVMDMIGLAGVDRIVTLDLHAPQIQGFTNLPVDQLSFRPALVDSLKNRGIQCVVAPDIGAVKRAEEYANALKVDLVVISKKRLGETSVELQHFIGDVEGKEVLIIDDLTESAGTIIQAAKACIIHGTIKVNCAITHGCFSFVGYENLLNAFKNNIIDNFYVSNSINFDMERKFKVYGDGHGYGRDSVLEDYSDKLKIVDMAPWFAKAIKNISNNESVTELFQ